MNTHSLFSLLNHTDIDGVIALVYVVVCNKLFNIHSLYLLCSCLPLVGTLDIIILIFPLRVLPPTFNLLVMKNSILTVSMLAIGTQFSKWMLP